MRVEVLNGRDEVINPLDGIEVQGLREASLEPYINKRSGLSDPRVVFLPHRWIHLSTGIKKGYKVREVETDRLITLPDETVAAH